MLLTLILLKIHSRRNPDNNLFPNKITLLVKSVMSDHSRCDAVHALCAVKSVSEGRAGNAQDCGGNKCGGDKHHH